MIINKIYKYLIPLVLGSALFSCADGLEMPEIDEMSGIPGTMTIRFSNTNNESRSEESDDTETLIENLVVALYPQTADADAEALHMERITGLDSHDSYAARLTLNRTMVASLFGNTVGRECKIYAIANLSDEEFDMVPEKPSINQLKALSVGSTFDTQKVQPSFVMAGEGTLKYTDAYTALKDGQAEGDVTLRRAATKISLNLQVPETLEIPDKHEEWRPIPEGMRCVLVNGVKNAIACPEGSGLPDQVQWKPADDGDYYTGSLAIDGAVHSFENNESTGEDAYPYQIDVPFYSYPNAWENEASEEITPTNQTTMLLIIPWELVGSETDTRRNYFYQVPVTPADLPFISRNYAYSINLKVGMLGSLDPQLPIPLDDLSYKVVDWSATDVEVNIKGYRYLVVNPNVYVINNETDFRIPYYTSHPVDITDVSITFKRFAYVTNGANPNVGRVADIVINQEQIEHTNTNTYLNPTGEKIITYQQDTESNQTVVRIHHPMKMWDAYSQVDNGEGNLSYNPVSLYGRSPGYTEESFNAAIDEAMKSIYMYVPVEPEYPAFYPYIIKFRIRHADNPNFYEDITITQYPDIYIEADRNPQEMKVISTVSELTNHPNPPGNVYVNRDCFVYRGSVDYGDDNPNNLGSLRGIYIIYDKYGNPSGGSSEKNPNMYVMNVTRLSEGSEFVIGDPRALYYNNDLSGPNDLPTPTENGDQAGDWCATAQALYPTGGSKRRLTYYYPTIESDATIDMIAPKFRISSCWGIASWTSLSGTHSEATRELARRRCATYQEQGCPAGRWRLPTYAEFKYICTLSAQKKIPEIFSKNTGYWTAQGLAWYDENNVYHLSKPPLNERPTTKQFTVRAVYDDWYWEQYPQFSISKTTFEYTYPLDPDFGGGNMVTVTDGYEYTLGDMPRGER